MDLVINKANQLQKIIEINEANNALDYLLSEITSATNAEVKGSMSKLVEIQLKTKMIANMRENSTIKIIDSPFIPSKKSGPLRAIIAFLTFIISIFLIIPFYAFFSYNARTRSDNTELMDRITLPFQYGQNCCCWSGLCWSASSYGIYKKI